MFLNCNKNIIKRFFYIYDINNKHKNNTSTKRYGISSWSTNLQSPHVHTTQQTIVGLKFPNDIDCECLWIKNTSNDINQLL